MLRIKRHPTSIVRDIDRAAPMAWEQLSAPCTTLSHCTRHAVRRRPYWVLRSSSAATQDEIRKLPPAYWSQFVAYAGQIRRALLSRAAYGACATRSLPPCTPLRRGTSAAQQARAEGCCDRAWPLGAEPSSGESVQLYYWLEPCRFATLQCVLWLRGPTPATSLVPLSTAVAGGGGRA